MNLFTLSNASIKTHDMLQNKTKCLKQTETVIARTTVPDYNESNKSHINSKLFLHPTS